MNTQDPLANLADIHLPAPVSSWPPAPGWWLLAVLAAGVVFGLIYWLTRRYRRLAWRREAKAKLQHLQAEKANLSAIAMASELSGLLKQAAITRYGRHHTASLNGEAWLRFLDNKGKTDAFSKGLGRALGDAIYRPDADIDVDVLFELSRKWIETQS